MRQKILDELFEKIFRETGVRDIAYHEIRDGRLNPVHKTNTDTLGIEKWKNVHGQNPVYVKDTYILLELLDKKQPVDVSDVKNDTRSADAFFLFGISSILIIPVVKENSVKGIICIASIGELHNFLENEITQCEQLVKAYTNLI